MAQMTQSQQQAKADADDAKEDAKIEAAEAKAKAEAAKEAALVPLTDAEEERLKVLLGTTPPLTPEEGAELAALQARPVILPLTPQEIGRLAELRASNLPKDSEEMAALAAREGKPPLPPEPPKSESCVLDPYRAEMHAILEGALGIIRTLVQVTPGAGNAPEQAVASLIERFHALTASGKPPEA